MTQKIDRTKMSYKLDAVLQMGENELTEEETWVQVLYFRPTLLTLPIKDIVIWTEELFKITKVAPDIANHILSRIVYENWIQVLERRRQKKKQQ